MMEQFLVGLVLFAIWAFMYFSMKYKEDRKDQERQSRKIDKFFNKEKPKITLEAKENQNSSEYKIKKGKDYEYFIMKFFQEREYKVYPKGYVEGKNDEGIDLIAYKNNEILLIQCKNWKYPPKQKDVKVFITDCEFYINTHQDTIKDKMIRKIFATTNKKMDYGVKCYLDEYNSKSEIKIEYMIIQMP